MPCAIFVRHLRFRLVKNKNRNWIRVFLCVPCLIIKISIIVLTPRAHQLPWAIFVRRLRFRLVNNRNRNGIRVFSCVSWLIIKISIIVLTPHARLYTNCPSGSRMARKAKTKPVPFLESYFWPNSRGFINLGWRMIGTKPI